MSGLWGICEVWSKGDGCEEKGHDGRPTRRSIALMQVLVARSHVGVDHSETYLCCDCLSV